MGTKKNVQLKDFSNNDILPKIDIIDTDTETLSATAPLSARRTVEEIDKVKDSTVKRTEMGAASGVATLDDTGKVPDSQLPSSVNSIIEGDSKSSFPETGETGKIYVARDTNLTYRWTGTEYVEISQSVSLGETGATAYPGDKGKETSDSLKELMKTVYMNHITANIKVTPSVIYKGVETEVTITYGGEIIGSDVVPKYTVSKGGAVTDIASGGKEKITLDDMTKGIRYSVEVEAGGVKKSAEATVNGYWPIYTFSSLKSDGWTAEEIKAGTRQEARSTPAGATYSIDTPANGYFVIAWADGNVSGAVMEGFGVPLTEGADVDIDGITYHTLRCAEAQTAKIYTITYK